MSHISYEEFLKTLLTYLKDNQHINQLPNGDFNYNNSIHEHFFNDYMDRAIYERLIVSIKTRVPLGKYKYLNLRFTIEAMERLDELEKVILPSDVSVVYLLGAGASANAIPVIANLAKGMTEMVGILKEYVGQLPQDPWEQNILDSPNVILEKFISDFEQTIEKSNEFNSIDEYALFLNDKTDKAPYEEIKRILSVYMILQQYKSPIDKRYLSFISKIKTNDRKMHKKISIMSWNYDLQMEMAFTNFYEYPDLSYGRTELSIYQKYANDDIPKNCFTLTKVNGSANILQTGFKSRTINYCSECKNGLNLKVINDVMRNYYYCKFKIEKYWSGLSFAWEKFENDSFLSGIKAIFKKATHLVIIGYSFPDYNRHLDKEILGSLENVQEIIVQVMAEHVEEVKFRLSKRIPADLKYQVVHISPNQFYIPAELD